MLASAAERPAVRAEHVRLAEEMSLLVEENRWDGVDDYYRRLLSIRGVKPTYQDHWLGAQAASAQGDVRETWIRLQQALAVEFTDEALAWWASLSARYGEVSIKTRRSYSGEHSLRVMVPPMDPEPRATIEAARAALAETQGYQGPLPLGQYRIGDLTFEVLGGPSFAVVLR